MRDKYLRRPKELEAITLAQFSKRYFSVKMPSAKSEDAIVANFESNEHRRWRPPCIVCLGCICLR